VIAEEERRRWGAKGKRRTTEGICSRRDFQKRRKKAEEAKGLQGPEKDRQTEKGANFSRLATQTDRTLKRHGKKVKGGGKWGGVWVRADSKSV